MVTSGIEQLGATLVNITLVIIPTTSLQALGIWDWSILALPRHISPWKPQNPRVYDGLWMLTEVYGQVPSFSPFLQPRSCRTCHEQPQVGLVGSGRRKVGDEVNVSAPEGFQMADANGCMYHGQNGHRAVKMWCCEALKMDKVETGG